MKKTVALLLALSMVFALCGCSSSDYNKAQNLLKQGRFDEAGKAFEALEDYKDSQTMVKECHYQQAQALLSEGKYDDAIELFGGLEDYKDSASLLQQSEEEKKQALFDSLEGVFHSSDLEASEKYIGRLYLNEMNDYLNGVSYIKIEKSDSNELFAKMYFNISPEFTAEGVLTVKGDKKDIFNYFHGIDFEIKTPKVTGKGWSSSSSLVLEYVPESVSFEWYYREGNENITAYFTR